MSIYDYSIVDRNEKEISLKEYKGKVLIIIDICFNDYEIDKKGMIICLFMNVK